MTAAQSIQKNAPMRQDLGRSPVPKLLKSFAIPSIFALLISALYNIVDQVFIGHSVGMDGNAATNVAFPLVTICTALGLLCGIGSAANFNLCMGKKEPEKAAQYVGNGLVMMIGLGLILFLVTQIFMEPLLRLFGGTDRIMAHAITYTHITSFGFPFLIIGVAATNLVRADGAPTYSMISIIAGCIFNIVFDPILIFGFNLGMAGAAWATILGQLITAIMLLAHFKRFRTLRLKKADFAIRPHAMWTISKLGIGSFFNQVAILFVQITINNIILFYGPQSSYGVEAPLAAIGIIIKISMIFFSICIGVSQGLQPIVSYNYGAQKYDRVQKGLILASVTSLTCSTLATLIFQIFPLQIIQLFGDGSPEYFDFAVKFFRIFLICYFINGLQPIMMNFFASIGKAQKAVLISLSRQIILFIPLAIALSAFLGLEGLLFAQPIADAAAGVLSIILSLYEIKHMKNLERQKAKQPELIYS